MTAIPAYTAEPTDAGFWSIREDGVEIAWTTMEAAARFFCAAANFYRRALAGFWPLVGVLTRQRQERVN